MLSLPFGRIWAFLFLILFLLSLDYWWWSEPASIATFGLPWWIFYFAGLQLVFIVTCYFFIRNVWEPHADFLNQNRDVTANNTSLNASAEEL